MFDTPTQSIEQQAAQLAEEIALEDDAISQLDTELTERKDKNKYAKAQLAELLMQAGIDSIRLKSGLTPRLRINRRFYKQSGITDDDLFTWLNENQLASIIKPTVHFQTLQATLKEHEEQGNILPDNLFNIVDEKTITMYGKSKFLSNHERSTE
jgi:hypothetical protein